MGIPYEKFHPGNGDKHAIGAASSKTTPHSFIAAGDGNLSVTIRVVPGCFSLAALNHSGGNADAMNSVLVQRCSGDTFSFHSFYCKFRDGMHPFHRGIERPQLIRIAHSPPAAAAAAT